MKFLSVALFTLLVTPLHAQEGVLWPEFRGPQASGFVEGAPNLPTEWSEAQNVAWKNDLHGLGWSTPAIADGKLWLTTATLEGDRMSLLCIDAATGETLVDRVLVTTDNPEPLNNKMNTYASSSPVIDEERVYIHFGSYGTFCFDRTTEAPTLLWQRRDFTASHWRGPASSPALYKDKLILTFDGADQQYHVALDKRTGETLWRHDRITNYDDLDKNGRPTNSGDLRKAYCTPVFAEFDGITHLISAGAKACWGHDVATGEPLWSVHYATHSPSSRPVWSEKHQTVYVNTGLGKSEVWAVKLTGDTRGELTETDAMKWQLLKRTPKRSSPVVVGDLFFMAADGVGSCVDAITGEVYWAERLGSDYSASLLATDDRVYFFDEVGVCNVVKASKTFEKVAENTLADGLMASPAVAGEALIVRTKSALYRIGK